MVIRLMATMTSYNNNPGLNNGCKLRTTVVRNSNMCKWKVIKVRSYSDTNYLGSRRNGSVFYI